MGTMNLRHCGKFALSSNKGLSGMPLHPLPVSRGARGMGMRPCRPRMPGQRFWITNRSSYYSTETGVS